MNIIVYYYRGGIERGTGTSYEWRNGYSENTPDGAITYPWMTVRECQADARKRGAIATFGTPVNKIAPKEDGCGKPIRVAGTNGGTMHCGGLLTGLDGNTAPEFCDECKEAAL